MINDTLFSIVAYRPNKDRIISLLDNDELSSVVSLFFVEDQRYQSRYIYTIASGQIGMSLLIRYVPDYSVTYKLLTWASTRQIYAIFMDGTP